MAKKVRRVRQTATQETKTRPDDSPPLTKEEALREEYAYVLKDLRRVFIIAGAMFILLIVLNLLI